MSSPILAAGPESGNPNPALTSDAMLGWAQSWVTPSSFPALGSKPVGVYKVKSLEAEGMRSRFNGEVSVGFSETDTNLVRLKLGDVTKSSLEVKSANATAVTLNATGTDSAFVLQSGDAAKGVSVRTDANRTSLTTTSERINLASIAPNASGQASFMFGTDKSVTFRARDSANVNTLLNLTAANVDVNATSLNANSDVRVKQSLALQKDGTSLAIGRLANVSTDFASVTIGGVPGFPNSQPARFESSQGGAKTWLNGSAHYFDGGRLGVNFAGLPTNTTPTAELDVNGRILARESITSSNIWAQATDSTMNIGWGMNNLGDVGAPKKIVLQADTIEIVGGIDMMNKSELRVVDTTVYLGHIPAQADVDESQAVPGAPGRYADTHYDGAGLVLWNMPDNYQTAYDNEPEASLKPQPKDYQQGLRWYKRGGVFTTGGAQVEAWNRASWEVSGGNLTLRAGTGHASYMFAIDYADGDALKLYKVAQDSITEVAAFTSPIP